ncbi:hypothetical protein E2C01_091135 [Portunus trituberculatus]|uniref:Uncharacterized protein n=1 Tax=Portunus trituberculatus TaxID=210409 RepID=A0A5B7JRZ5_PORTR|nr:hypothetical protein [Portunus trituberculatus]
MTPGAALGARMGGWLGRAGSAACFLPCPVSSCVLPCPAATCYLSLVPVCRAPIQYSSPMFSSPARQTSFQWPQRTLPLPPRL